MGSAEELDPSEWQVPPHCIPIHANVTTFDWSKLYSVTSFDVIMMDPPWQLATANPTRGVALGYSQLTGEFSCVSLLRAACCVLPAVRWCVSLHTQHRCGALSGVGRPATATPRGTSTSLFSCGRCLLLLSLLLFLSPLIRTLHAHTDADICGLPISQLQGPGGLLFVWVINSKVQFTLDLFDRWGYT